MIRRICAVFTSAMLVAGVSHAANGDAAPSTRTDSKVTMATAAPGVGFQRLQTFMGYAEGECMEPRASKRIAQARADLQDRAAAAGADYVRVIGVGSIDQRGLCIDDFFRVTGVGYMRTE